MFDDLLTANEAYSAGFALRGLEPRAARGLCLVSCMDSRIEPLSALGLVPGDAKILRNAGGRVTEDTLRSLILATHFLGVDRIAVMQHTKCAMAGRSDDDYRADLRAAGVAGSEDWEFLAMTDPDRSLRADVGLVRACRLIDDRVEVAGWRYDVDTGAVAVVVEP